MPSKNLGRSAPTGGVTGAKPAAQNPYNQGGQGGYGRFLPGVPSQGSTGSQASVMPVGSPWMNPAAGQQQGGSVMPVNQPRPYQPQQPPQMTTMAMGEEGGSGSPGVTPTPGVVPQHPFAGSPTAPPPRPPQPRAPAGPPAIPKNIAAGPEQDYRPGKQELKQMSPQERSAANHAAHNARAADNRHDANHRGALLRNAGNERRADNRQQAHQPPPPPMVGGPATYLPFTPGQGIGGINFGPQMPGTGGQAPAYQQPQMSIPRGAEVVDQQPGGASVMPVGFPRQFNPQASVQPVGMPRPMGGQDSQFTQALMRALGG